MSGKSLEEQDSRGGDSGQAMEQQLQALDDAAAAAGPGDGAPFAQAGDLALSGGQRQRALEYYGRAIDTYLSGSRYDAAAAVCRRVLRIAPRAVRTRATLAWIALGRGVHANARREIEEYVRAALRAGEEQRAARQLSLMAQATLDPDLRRIIAELLGRLGAVKEAERVISDMSETSLRRMPSAAEQEQVWAQVLQAALMGPRELDAHGRDDQHPPDVMD
ncbi:MAG TPA: hypothetical protein VFU06_04020 [Longimicrobiales bacterium]|nr:hypothetical protein [Longimicrobiales bacterium]